MRWRAAGNTTVSFRHLAPGTRHLAPFFSFLQGARFREFVSWRTGFAVPVPNSDSLTPKPCDYNGSHSQSVL
jgi:hypothetical protein